MTTARRVPPGVRGALARDPRSLAQLITGIEVGDPSVQPVLKALYPKTGHARLVGITGPLGVGKSSLINALLRRLREAGTSVGIVAVDPSSPFSGGSVLGDRIRLERRPEDRGVFIRSMASRGHAGGVAATTREVTRLLDAVGFDVILIETVGSGQVDIEIRDVATTNVVVLVPHLGDEVQTLKAGLFEIADVFCLNKADLPGVEGATRDLAELVGLGASASGWRPPIVATSTETDAGIEDLWKAVEAHEAFLDSSGLRSATDRDRAAREIEALVRDRVGSEVQDHLLRSPSAARLLDRVVAREIDPRAAASQLYRELRPRA
ncbi:MAG: methylmalonyl Co-A mutase-associated GTPase MeaB [Thermoplasmata archaeon]